MFELPLYEDCFCGRIGPMADREPVYCDDGTWGLRCRVCGDFDRLEWLNLAARDVLLREANGGAELRAPEEPVRVV